MTCINDDTLLALVPRRTEARAAAAIWHKTVSQHEALRFCNASTVGFECKSEVEIVRRIIDGVRYQLVLLWPMTNENYAPLVSFNDSSGAPHTRQPR